MKILLFSFIAFVWCLTGISQDSESLGYQTVVHNSEGQVVARQYVSLKFSIFVGNPFDSVVYSEKHREITSELGLVSVMIGKGTDKTGSFESIEWNADKYYLKVEVDASGGINYTDLGTMQIISAPYISPSEAASGKSQSTVKEDKLFISRKYVGKFLDFRQTGPADYNGPNIIWIKTTMESTFGKISAFGKKCAFSVGDNLYLKRSYLSPGGVFGRWDYRIENDSSVYYRLSDFQYDRKVLIEDWFK